MFEFLRDNPYLIFLALIVLFNLFSKKKKGAQAKEAAKPPQSPARTQSPVRAQVDTPRAQTTQEKYRSRIEEALREAMNEADRSTQGSQAAGISGGTRPTPSRAIASPAEPKPSSDDPFAFHSLMDAGAKGRVDYDETATDYDTKGGGDAFAFREAIAEPADKEFHLSSFAGFHTAQRMTVEDRRTAAGDDAYSEPVEDAVFSVGNVDELRRAFIIQEVLGRPKAHSNTRSS